MLSGPMNTQRLEDTPMAADETTSVPIASRFFTFGLELQGRDGPLGLTLSGPDGVNAFWQTAFASASGAA